MAQQDLYFGFSVENVLHPPFVNAGCLTMMSMCNRLKGDITKSGLINLFIDPLGLLLK